MNKAKDITQKILISLSALLVTVSCTLDMEDWVPTEEEKGYGEIASMEYDGMKFEYEFKDETIHLTDNLLEYLAYTDGDTILYFMDNMPEEYRPRTGGYVAAFCCDALPLGLNAKVTSVEHSNGMYMVETKPVELAETYKEFKLDLDMDLRFAHPDDSTSASKARKMKVKHKKRAMRPSTNNDLNYEIDWTTYDYMTQGGLQTRADDFDYEEDDTIEEDQVQETAIFDIDINSSEFGKSILKDPDAHKWLSLLPKYKAAVYSIETMHVNKIIDVAKKREYTKTISTKGFRVNMSCGSSFDPIAFIKEHAEAKKALDSAKKEAKKEGMLSQFNDGAFAVEVPLGPVPCVFRVKPDLSFTLSLIGNVDTRIWSSKTQTVTEVINGKVIKDETINLEKPSPQSSLNVVGEAGVTGGVELFFGVGTIVAPGKVAGVGLACDLTAEMKFAYSATLSGDAELANSKDGLSASVSIGVGGKVLAGNWVDVKFAYHKWDIWSGAAFPYYPVIKSDMDYRIFHDTDASGKKYREITYSYEISKLGTHFSNWYKTHIPCLIVQKGLIPERVYPDGGRPTKTEKKKYTFTYRTYDQDKTLTIYPCLQYTEDESHGDVYYIQQQTAIPAHVYPKIKYTLTEDVNLFSANTYKHVYQTKGTWATKTDGTKYSYSFELPIQLSNAGCIPDYWDDWGLYYAAKVTKPDGSMESLGGKYFSMKDKIKRSGQYEIEKSFSYTANGFKPKVEVESLIYYVKRGEHEKRYIEGVESKDFQGLNVSYREQEGYKLLQHYYEMSNEFKNKNRPSWYHKYSVIK